MGLLRVENLSLSYDSAEGKVKALNGVTFELGEGQALGLVGESGSGKSSIALSLFRMLPANSNLYQGSIIFDGQDLIALSDEQFRKDLRWSKISMVFQGAMNALNPVMRIGDQIGETLIGSKKLPKASVPQRVKDMLDIVGLSKQFINRYPHELSGGMKQRVLIAMALVEYPKLIILDEPTSSLDVSIQAQIINLLKDLKKEFGLTLIFITHDIALASDICDLLAVVYAGTIVEIGTLEEVLAAPHHPYTTGLLESHPRLHSNSRPKFIPGTPVNLIDQVFGCPFQDRCGYSSSRCSSTPPIVKIGEHHSTRCWLY